MQQFKIRTSFLFPLGLTCLLLAVLLMLCIVQREATGKVLILTALMLPVVGLFIASWYREITVNADEIVARRLFRHKRIKLTDVTALDTVRVRRRIFISISTEADFLILSNNYDHFDQLLARLMEQLPETLISTETRTLSSDLPKKSSDLFSIWLAVMILLLILYVQLTGTF